MPIYEYQCEDCGKISEFLIGVSREDDDIRCQYCGSEKMKKILSKSFVSASGNLIGSQGGKTCCGREERCEKPPCSTGGGRKR
jgi:putative FmdB family regulatory protein